MGAFAELALSGALLIALLYSIVAFFRFFGGGELGVRRFAYLPIGLAIATLYAVWRVRRALRRYREASRR